MKAEHKRWLQRVARYADDHGCWPKDAFTPYQIHHVVGRTGRHNKVDIGNWFVLPIHPHFHDPNSDNKLNITHFRKRFTERYGSQVDLWKEMVDTIMEEDGELPFGEDVYWAICQTRY